MTASVVRMIAGEQSPELVTFDRGWGSSACDDGTPIPEKGDKWVVYYLHDTLGRVSISETYPVGVALRADPRLKSIIK